MSGKGSFLCISCVRRDCLAPAATPRRNRVGLDLRLLHEAVEWEHPPRLGTVFTNLYHLFSASVPDQRSISTVLPRPLLHISSKYRCRSRRLRMLVITCVRPLWPSGESNSTSLRNNPREGWLHYFLPCSFSSDMYAWDNNAACCWPIYIILCTYRERRASDMCVPDSVCHHVGPRALNKYIPLLTLTGKHLLDHLDILLYLLLPLSHRLIHLLGGGIIKIF